MTYLAVAVAALVVLGIFVMLGATFVVLARAQQGSTDTVSGAQLAEVRAEIDRIDRAVKELPSIYEAAAERAKDSADRAKKRLAAARAAESRARREAADDDDDGPEDREQGVLQLDEARGRREGMQPVPGDVEPPAQDDLTERAIAAGWSPFI